MNALCRRSAVLVLLSLAAGAVAQGAELDAAGARTMLNRKGCNACHAVDEMRIGPPFAVIGVRYAADGPERIAKLAAKIRFGGAGAWGNVPMVSNPGVSQDEAEKIARWILRQRPAPARP